MSERDLNEGDLEIFTPKLQEILNFEYFLSLKIQLNYPKGFWKEKKLVG